MPAKRKSTGGTSHVAKKGKEEEYGWKQVSKDLEADKYVGTYGGANSAWHGLAGIRAKKNLKDFHGKRSKDEIIQPLFDKYFNNPHTQRRWDQICTIDPMGLFANHPTMAGTKARMDIPELSVVPDGDIVNEDGSVNVMKSAMDYVWNLPKLAKRIGMDEMEMRKSLAEYTQNAELVNRPDIKTYLPPLAACTAYIFGDVNKLGNPETEVAVRVHDACCGSDVFGTDICTCRPYLMFAVQACIECAQRGGVGVVVYFAKEGRGLGEVTKYRVYNARKNQEGGDTAENYFNQTSSIAGIEDARFQEMMPDILVWLGIDRIDWLLSMSHEKYNAIVGAGIKVMQRVSLPDAYIPRDAHVEINAKIAAGYHCDTIDVTSLATNLRQLEMVRTRTAEVFELALKDKNPHFKLNMSKLPKCIDYVIDTTMEHYKSFDDIPYHSRWRHFDQKDVDDMVASWPCDATEQARRLIDMVTVSVFLDAGAGNQWHYMTPSGESVSRSEGLAVATMDMFKDGVFSSDIAAPHRVNAHGLKHLELRSLQKGFQVNETTNPLTGLEERHGLLLRIANALQDPKNSDYFGKEICRPGNIVDYVLKHVKNGRVSLKVLWKAVIEGYESIWPENMAGVRRGDVWVYNPLKTPKTPGSDLIPFHKLSQWLTYSLLEPFEQLGVAFDDLELMTGLAEYRNGGLFVDMGVLELRTPRGNHHHATGSELVVEWRALTVQLLDKVWEAILKKKNLTKAQLPLAKVLQGGTWAAGRKIAASKRSNKSSPIQVRLDGTVF